MHDNGFIELEAFHAGDRAVLTAVYRRHVGAVERTISRYCRGAEAECVTHDVFLSLIERAEVRRSFTGGNMGAWLCTIAARKAIDHLRRRRRWLLMDGPRSLEGKLEPIDEEQSLLHRDQLDHVKQSLEAFSGQVLPKLNRKLAEVFRLRFTEGLSQTEAAQRLGVPRSTLGDREQRLLAHLTRFVCRYQRAR